MSGVMREKIAEALLLLGEEEGFMILEELPCCQDCAVYQMVDEGLGASDPYCFYHQRDLAAVEDGMFLSWGSSTDDALAIVRRMNDAGLVASWDGDPDHRIHVRLP